MSKGDKVTLSKRQVKMRKATKPAAFLDAEAALRYLHYIHFKQRRRQERRLRRLAKIKTQEGGAKNEG